MGIKKPAKEGKERNKNKYKMTKKLSTCTK